MIASIAAHRFDEDYPDDRPRQAGVTHLHGFEDWSS